MTVRRFALWSAALVVIVGLSRQIAYALTDTPLAERLSSQGGGTSPVVVAVVGLGIAFVASAIGLWLVATGLRERSALELERWESPPRPIRLGPLVRRTLLLSVASSTLFTSVESWVHYQAGLGFHAYHCLFGPVHQDALPILVALSVVVSALVAAVEAVAAAARRLVARLVRTNPPGRARRVHHRLPSSHAPHSRAGAGGKLSRGPPLLT